MTRGSKLTYLGATLPRGCKGSRKDGWALGLSLRHEHPRGTSTQTPSLASVDTLLGYPSWGKEMS